MPIDKIVPSVAEAVSGISSGMTIMISGFGFAGVPNDLIQGVLDLGATDLTVISNNAGTGTDGLAALIGSGRVRRIICSYPRSKGSDLFDARYAAGEIELELVPQGTLSERMRAAGAGIGGFFTPTGAGTELAAGKEIRMIDGREYVLETPLRADVALVQAQAADRWGNLVYAKAGRNFGPVMAMAADLTVVQVREIVPLGLLDPEVIVTPSIFVDRVTLMDNEREWDI
ncbi:MAG: 3-oxoacid CoA-transferase subunit A [Alphaproteobacteria bacterium]|nr:3-oxoacid CoA-transferase subunit A [Alphaproteobacteria bacterium]